MSLPTLQHIRTQRSWFLVLLGSIFAIPALLIFVLSILPALFSAFQMQSWEAIQGNLLSSDIEYHNNDQTTTYQAVAEYSYHYRGEQYRNSRVSVHSGSDNIGDYQKKMANKLSRIQATGGTVTVYVNPADPNDAVLDRHVRWELIGMKLVFVLIFSMIGVALIAVGWRGSKKIISLETQDKPWLSKLEWADNKITSNTKPEIYVLGFFAILWNLMTWPGLFALPKAYAEKGLWVAALLCLFPLAGVYLLTMFIRKFRQWRRYGQTFLTLNPFPGAIGGQVAGTIEVNAVFPDKHRFNVQLMCSKQFYSGVREKHLQEKLIWEKSSVAQVRNLGDRTVLMFQFDLPDGLPESDIDQDDAWHLWRLEVVCEDHKLERSFEIPVFNTGESSSLQVKVPQPSSKLSKLGKAERDEEINEYLPIQGEGNRLTAVLEQQHNPVILHYPMFYKPKMKLFSLLLGTIFAGLGVSLWHEAPALLCILFVFLGGLTALVSLITLLSSLTVVLDKQNIVTIRRFMGINLRQQRAPVSRIETIEPKETLRSESTGKHTVYYQILARLKNGKVMMLAKQIKGEQAAVQVVGYFDRVLGLNKKTA